MRDYRFRVWNPATETMTYNVGLDSISEYYDESAVVMQYVGDYGQFAVYEEDMFEFTCTSGIYIDTVKWDAANGRYAFLCSDGNWYGLDEFQSDKAERIGNTFMHFKAKKEEEGG